MVNENDIKVVVKNLIVEVMEYEDMSPSDIQDDAPFFGTDENPGLIHDSLAVLELATRLGEEYEIMPEDFSEEAFTNVNSLTALILEKTNVEA